MSSRNYKIVKLKAKGPDGTVRYGVADLNGNIIDRGAHKTGYKSPVKAHRGYAWREKNLDFSGARDFRMSAVKK